MFAKTRFYLINSMERKLDSTPNIKILVLYNSVLRSFGELCGGCGYSKIARAVNIEMQMRLTLPWLIPYSRCGTTRTVGPGVDSSERSEPPVFPGRQENRS